MVWLENCPTKFKPVVYKKYNDDTFLVFGSTEYVEKKTNYLTSHIKIMPLHLKLNSLVHSHV